MKRHNNGILLLMAALFSTNQIVYAAEPKFNIVPISPVFTFLLPSNFTETVQYRVTNQTKITRNLTMVPLPGVTQTVVGNGVCGNPFTLAPQQSCILSLVINGSQIPASGISGGPEICKTKGPGNSSPDPFLCSKPSLANTLAVSVTTPGKHAYIANQFSNSVSFCQVNPATGFLSQCAITATGLAGTEGIGFNPAGTLFYSANPLSSSISVCQFNQATGALSGCTDAGGSGFNLPDAVTFSPDGSIFYTSNFGSQTVSACLVDATTGLLSSCVNNPSPTFGAPGDMVVNAAGNFAYVANRTNNTISVCNVSGQTVNSCDDTSGSHINGPEGVTLSATGLQIYIANAGDRTVVVCDIRQDGTGLLANCSVTDGPFAGTGNVGLSGLFAYVPNQILNEVFVCNITLINGQLSSCQRSHGTGFVGPAGVVVN